ncbi:hypothetical protein [Actinophytocola oryzae]|uniref:hypothetical protein n=1 Tax=Actinophytocola oryzae TaxID=502181 RepID=UPI0010645267|nr:hypothetical protein [Actinophytocola oryzae]
MDCDTCREALSARTDGEPEPTVPDGHLRDCVACQDWYATVNALTWFGADDLAPTPDVTDAVLGSVEPRTGLLGTRWRRSR